MTRAGRPLRFLGTTLAGWTALRIAMLWPVQPTASSVIQTIVPGLSAATIRPVMPTPPPARSAVSTARLSARKSAPPDDAAHKRRVAQALVTLVRFGDPQIAIGPPGEMIASPMAVPAMTPPSRAKSWSADFWLVARGGSHRQTGFGGGELGGGQAGARIAYALDRAHRLAAFARFERTSRG